MTSAKLCIRSRADYPKRPFGYWAQKADASDPRPWPVVSVSPDAAFLVQLLAVEAALRARTLDGGVMHFMGSSTSRLTGERLGSAEFYVFDDAQGVRTVWPEDYGPHYLAAGVAPDPDFVALIGSLHAALTS